MNLLPSNDKTSSSTVGRWLLVFFVIAFFLHIWRIFSLNATYDQGLFLQEIWNGLHGRPFESTLASELSAPVFFDNALPRLGYRHLAQHFTPLLVLWIPLVGILGLWALPFIQVGLIASSGWILFLLGKEHLPSRLAGWIACSFFLTAPVLGPSLENFHDLCLVPVLVFTLLLGISRNQKLLYFIPALLLPLVREDVGLISFGIGIWMLARRPGWRIWGLGLCFYSIIYVLTVTNVAMPSFGSELSRRFMQERFSQYLHGKEGSTIDVLFAMFSQPLLLIKELIFPPLSTFRLLITLVLPLAFIPWFSKDSWLLIACPLFVALSSQGGNAMSVNLRFMLYLVPGIFAGSVFWWSNHRNLFDTHSFKRFWKICICLALSFAIVGNPHRSLSSVIPDSFEPWVHVPIKRSWDRGIAVRKLIKTLPKEVSIAAETQLIPQLAKRYILLRFPEHYQYTDHLGETKEVDLIISQLRYNLTYAPAFRRNANWVSRSIETMENLIKSGRYGVLSCDNQSIVLKKGLQSSENLSYCFSREIELAKDTLNQVLK